MKLTPSEYARLKEGAPVYSEYPWCDYKDVPYDEKCPRCGK